MVNKEYRNLGLSKFLMELILEEWEINSLLARQTNQFPVFPNGVVCLQDMLILNI